MSTIVGILAFTIRKKIVLSLVGHEKSFITSRPGPMVKFYSLKWIRNVSHFSCISKQKNSLKITKNFMTKYIMLINSKGCTIQCLEYIYIELNHFYSD